MRSRSFSPRRLAGLILAGGLMFAPVLMGVGLLLAPGASPAEEPGPPAACMEREGASPSCGAQQSPEPKLPPSRLDAERMQERMRAELLADGEPPVVLNGRGYNYDAPRDPTAEVQRILGETRKLKSEAKPE